MLTLLLNIKTIIKNLKKKKLDKNILIANIQTMLEREKTIHRLVNNTTVHFDLECFVVTIYFIENKKCTVRLYNDNTNKLIIDYIVVFKDSEIKHLSYCDMFSDSESIVNKIKDKLYKYYNLPII